MPDARNGDLRAGWVAIVGAAVGVRLWNALAGPLMWGYDAPGHLAYVFYLDVYQAAPWAHQGWGYFHPPLHYVAGWGLAQLGSAEILLRGLALLSSAASLGIAALAAFAARAACPERRFLSLLAFTAVAFLPVHLYASPMSGNEMTAAFFGSAAVALLIATGRRPRARGDAAVGALLGLSLLSKFAGATYAAVVAAAIALRAFAGGGGTRAALPRLAAAGGVALVLAGPFYARNVAEYGTPFRMNRDYLLTARVEQAQEPGVRTWRDYVSVSPRLITDPRPGAPHLIHSAWGTAYVNTWTDTRAMWNRLPDDDAERLRRARVSLLAAGLVPTALALAGALLAARDWRRGRRRDVYGPLLLLSGAALAAFVVFSLRVPTTSALKASYLLGLSLPFGAFLARAVEALPRRVAPVAGVAVALIAAGSAAVHTSGVIVPRHDDNGALGAVHALLGEHDAARALYERRLQSAPSSTRWIEPLAAVELAAGDAAKARALYERAFAANPGDPFLYVRLGTASALDGDPAEARRLFDTAARLGAGAAARANLGAVNAALGDTTAAERDLRAALAADPHLAPAWHNLAVVLERGGRDDEAAAARDAWRRAARRPPRGHPYGVGVGLLRPGLRPLLWLENDGLRLARAPFDG